jgi:hypothetical protein
MLARILVLALLFGIVSEPAHANVIWPAAILSGRLLAWWIIAASLVIEFFFVQRAFRLRALDAMWATIGANAATAVAGLFILPYAGLFMELGLHKSGLGAGIGWATFSLTAWLATFILAVVINLAIELAVYKYGYRLKIDRRAFWLIAAANVITAAIAFVSLEFVQVPDYGYLTPGLLPR